MIIVTHLSDIDSCVFRLSLIKGDDHVGDIYVDRHPHDILGAEVHLEIVPKWRCRWLSKSVRDEIMRALISTARKYELSTLYSIALTEASPRLLEFFGFIEYYSKQPKTYYYLNLRGDDGWFCKASR